jgi:2,3-bisphosphoglycerate-dependent phosphoglycerate mutase
MRILLIRHAQSLGQEPDADLSPEGHGQAHALISRLAGFGVREVFSSPYRRAMATVGPFAAHAGLQIHTIGDLRERKLSEGWLPDFLIHMERSFADERYELDGGESLARTASRGLQAIAEVAGVARTALPAVASHGNLIASVLRAMDPGFGFEAWRLMRNPHIYEVELSGPRPVAFRNLEIKA